MTKRMKPDFFCLGVQKAGTTWLYENLKGHPRVSSSLLKEPHYFTALHYWHGGRGLAEPLNLLEVYSKICDGFYWSLHPENKNYILERKIRWLTALSELTREPLTDSWYQKVYSLCEADQICGDFTPDYSILDLEGIQHIRSVNPAAKYIFILRDPVERSWSQLRMLTSQGVRKEDALELIENSDVFLRGDYQSIIEKWSPFMTDENSRIYFYDSISAEPRKLLDDIADFLGISGTRYDWPYVETIIHKGREEKIPDEIYEVLVQKFTNTLEFMAEHYPQPCLEWRRRHLHI